MQPPAPSASKATSLSTKSAPIKIATTQSLTAIRAFLLISRTATNASQGTPSTPLSFARLSHAPKRSPLTPLLFHVPVRKELISLALLALLAKTVVAAAALPLFAQLATTGTTRWAPLASPAHPTAKSAPAAPTATNASEDTLSTPEVPAYPSEQAKAVLYPRQARSTDAAQGAECA